MKIPSHILSKVREFFDKIRSTFSFTSKAEIVEGTLRATKVFPDGRKEDIFEQKNLIMLLSKSYILGSIYKPTFSLNLVNRLQVGIGGTIDPAGLYPKTVNQNLSALFTPLLYVTASYVENTTVPSVTFIADVDQTLGNGSLITEAGLLMTNGNLFNIKTFPGIPKTSDFSIHFEWTIRIA